MKLLMFNTQPYEVETFAKIANDLKVEIDWTEEGLSLDNVDKTKDYDAITIQQHGNLEGEDLYKRLAENGIKQISLRSTGYEIIDLDLANKYNLKITNVSGYSPRSVSELVLADTMALLRRLKDYSKREERNDFSWTGGQAREIHNLTVGVIGAGTIGSASARIFRALGARVLAYDPVQRTDLADTVEYVDVNRLLSESDVVTIHTPLTPEMDRFMNFDRFKKMKNDAIFINASRGGVVDTDALVAALEAGEIGAAGIDVFDGEAGITSVDLGDKGYDNDNLKALIAMDNVIVTPHIAFFTDIAVYNMALLSTRDAIKIVNGEEAIYPVN
ncbi:D-lactate dehydrogenase [Apilactobacillus kunkeei]|uniref:NAD(P)-dependent oxidoreductase n=1 Tax=Apilactobacillus kunkeei TaxID=148814 RepID=UPI001C6F912D|nr:NAD(P)-dependent oxidoreductase [Apilactobacillus kunkeei]MBX8454914.1 D-2-hydroxyacid dehydrogenase [Apilactobacillus kunkeei]QYU54464.1 D-2-hydroxyacid dehydrogenase [Apilactobacillus kunkeei]CAI2547517.1 D-lactate dehydrogenase [Apilactobacillus kunkeei]CAI2548632.1 D-lactate dehydrogenase [Apilactobacillus kunkeei]CAI2548677.1 D-lactate dehydrogenase [Apilactobacillus kunkeei]